MICVAHRLQCKTLHFPRHKLPVHATWNVQTHLKSTGFVCVGPGGEVVWVLGS